MIKNKKNKTFRPRNYINYTTRGQLYPLISLYNVEINSSYSFNLKDKKNLALYVSDTSLIYDKEISSLDKILKRLTKKIGVYRVLIKPYNAYTSKPSEVRMGKGKGKEEGYLARVVRGQCICYVSNIPLQVATDILKSAQFKLSAKTVIREFLF
jgi:large subunit ribosomal protein L16